MAPPRYDWNYSKVTSSKVGLKFCISFKQNHTVDGNQKSGKTPVEGKVVEIPLFYRVLAPSNRWLTPPKLESPPRLFHFLDIPGFHPKPSPGGFAFQIMGKLRFGTPSHGGFGSDDFPDFNW